jgi:hypothetical protein
VICVFEVKRAAVARQGGNNEVEKEFQEHAQTQGVVRFGGGRLAPTSSLAGLSRCGGRMMKSVLRQSPLRQTVNR